MCLLRRAFLWLTHDFSLMTSSEQEIEEHVIACIHMFEESTTAAEKQNYSRVDTLKKICLKQIAILGGEPVIQGYIISMQTDLESSVKEALQNNYFDFIKVRDEVGRTDQFQTRWTTLNPDHWKPVPKELREALLTEMILEGLIGKFFFATY